MLDDGLTSIGNSAFEYNSNITLSEIPSGVTSIGNSAFYGCRGIKHITFKGTPETIGSSVFSGCYNLTTINVPWAEGAVAGAPWGPIKQPLHTTTQGKRKDADHRLNTEV